MHTNVADEFLRLNMAYAPEPQNLDPELQRQEHRGPMMQMNSWCWPQNGLWCVPWDPNLQFDDADDT